MRPYRASLSRQNVTQAAAAGVTLSGSSTAFTIADLSRVWILCDVYENDMRRVKLGDTAAVSSSTHIQTRPLTGRIGDIGPVLDPSTAHGQGADPGNQSRLLKLGMFVTATFSSKQVATHALVPTTAVLHLHDRDWVFVPAGGNQFKRDRSACGTDSRGKPGNPLRRGRGPAGCR